MIIKLNCVDREHQGEKWLLSLDEDSALLSAPDGQRVARWTPEKAVEQFEMPSFSSGNQHVVITVDDYTWRFAVWPWDVKRINAFLHRAPTASSPEVRSALFRRALFQTVMGTCILAGGTAVTLDSFLKAERQPAGGEYTIFFGALLVGLSIMAKAISAFAEYRQLGRIAESNGHGQLRDAA